MDVTTRILFLENTITNKYDQWLTIFLRFVPEEFLKTQD